MRTIAIAASIALITGGGVAGIVVGGTGAQIARDYTPSSAVRTNVGASTTAMRRAPTMEAAADPTPAELRTGDDPAATHAQPVSVDLNAVFPEDRTVPPAAMPRSATRTPVTTLPRPAQRLQPAPARTIAAPAPRPTAVATRTPPARTAATPAASTTQITPAPAAATQSAQSRNRRPVRAAARTRPPARTPTGPVHTAPPPATAPASQPLATSPAITAPTPAAVDATHRTTMSQGDGGGSAPVSSSPPPATESPSALLANP